MFTANMTNADQWMALMENGVIAEMVIARGGQFLAPSLTYQVAGLKPQAEYRMSIEINRTDNFTYKWHPVDQVWFQHGSSESHRGYRLPHKDGEKKGSEWTAGGVNFEWVKLTNKREGLTSCHALVDLKVKYVPSLIIEEVDVGMETSIKFEEQTFVTVATVHNPKFKELKEKMKKGGVKRRACGVENGGPAKKKKEGTVKTNLSDISEISWEDESDEELDNLLQLSMGKQTVESKQPVEVESVVRNTAPVVYLIPRRRHQDVMEVLYKGLRQFSAQTKVVEVENEEEEYNPFLDETPWLRG